MSDQEKKAVQDELSPMLKKAKRFVFWVGFFHALAIALFYFGVAGKFIAGYVELPKEHKKLMVVVDSSNNANDIIHEKHNGYFSVIFQHVDTTKKR